MNNNIGNIHAIGWYRIFMCRCWWHNIPMMAMYFGLANHSYNVCVSGRSADASGKKTLMITIDYNVRHMLLTQKYGGYWPYSDMLKMLHKHLVK
jgi:hypothetical protein